MDHVFTPWRHGYVTSLTKRDDGSCVFCQLLAAPPEADEEGLVLLRGERCFVVLNRYPYTSGHLMIVPNEHLARLGEGSPELLEEMIHLAARCEQALETGFRPQGYNLGMNLGRAGGAGIEKHLHLHLVPRWNGDTNFMTVTGSTRVLPQRLDQVYRILRPLLAGEGKAAR